MVLKKFEKFICVFFVMAGFISAYVIGYNMGEKKDNNVIMKKDIIEERPYMYNNEEITTEMGEVSIKDEAIVKSDAVVILETYNNSENRMESKNIKVPVWMIGCNRADVVEYIKKNKEEFEYEDEKLENIMLVSFAENRVVLRKNVSAVQKSDKSDFEDSNRYNYYIALKENKVIVYKKDKETLFIETGITYDMVDKETRDDIEDGVWIENISTLYRYLESITS